MEKFFMATRLGRALLRIAAFFLWPADGGVLGARAAGGGSMIGKGYVDPLLSNFAVTYRPMGFIAQDVAPIVQVAKQTGIYAILEQADQFKIPDTYRSPGEEAKITRFRVGSANYNARNWALKTRVPLEDLANAQPPFLQMLEQSRTGTIMNQLLLDLENRTAQKFFNPANVGSAAAVASAWHFSTGGGSPFNDLNTAIDNVHNATGYWPNKLIFGRQAWFAFRRHNEIINKTQRTAQQGAAPMPTRQQAADLFEVEQVHVGLAYCNSAQEGQPLNLQPLWGPHVWIGYQKMDAMTVEDPTFLSFFRWIVPGIPNMQVERLPYDARIKAEELEIGYFQDENVVAPALGFLVQSVY